MAQGCLPIPRGPHVATGSWPADSHADRETHGVEQQHWQRGRLQWFRGVTVVDAGWHD